jgi:hypothetical protein
MTTHRPLFVREKILLAAICILAMLIARLLAIP